MIKQISALIKKPHPNLAMVLLISLLVMIGGCTPRTQPTIVRQQIVVVDIPQALYDACPAIRKSDLPKWQTMTDGEAASLITRLYSNNVQCRNAIEQIRKFVAEAKAKAEEQNRRNP